MSPYHDNDTEFDDFSPLLCPTLLETTMIEFNQSLGFNLSGKGLYDIFIYIMNASSADYGTLYNTTNGTYCLIPHSTSQDPHSEENWEVTACGVIVMALITIIAFWGNLSVILIILRTRRLRTQITNYFVISLCTADLLASLLVLPFSCITFARSDWQFGSIICTVHRLLTILLVCASCLATGAISVERYYAIESPMRHAANLTHGRALIVTAIVWSLALLLAALPLLLDAALGNHSEKEWDNWAHSKRRCSLVGAFAKYLSTAFVVCATVICYFVPCAVLAAMYWKIYQVAKKSVVKVHPIRTVSNPNAKPHPPLRSPNHEQERELFSPVPMTTTVIGTIEPTSESKFEKSLARTLGEGRGCRNRATGLDSGLTIRVDNLEAPSNLSHELLMDELMPYSGQSSNRPSLTPNLLSPASTSMLGLMSPVYIRLSNASTFTLSSRMATPSERRLTNDEIRLGLEVGHLASREPIPVNTSDSGRGSCDSGDRAEYENAGEVIHILPVPSRESPVMGISPGNRQKIPPPAQGFRWSIVDADVEDQESKAQHVIQDSLNDFCRIDEDNISREESANRLGLPVSARTCLRLSQYYEETPDSPLSSRMEGFRWQKRAQSEPITSSVECDRETRKVPILKLPKPSPTNIDKARGEFLRKRTITQEQLAIKHLEAHWKAAVTLLFILSTFVLLWSPYFLIHFYWAVAHVKADTISVSVEDVVTWIAFTSFATNAFVYGWMNRSIRDELRQHYQNVWAGCWSPFRRIWKVLGRKKITTRVACEKIDEEPQEECWDNETEEEMKQGVKEDFFQFLERTSSRCRTTPEQGNSFQEIPREN